MFSEESEELSECRESNERMLLKERLPRRAKERVRMHKDERQDGRKVTKGGRREGVGEGVEEDYISAILS